MERRRPNEYGDCPPNYGYPDPHIVRSLGCHLQNPRPGGGLPGPGRIGPCKRSRFSAIASEVLKDDAFVLYATGPRIRVYCLYDDDAISGEDASEGELSETPTDGDWRLSIPVLEEDFEWSMRTLKACAPHISVRKAGEEVREDSDAQQTESRAAVRINIDRFLEP